MQLLSFWGIIGYSISKTNPAIRSTKNYHKVGKILLVLIIFASVISLIITPYDLRANLWRAQEDASNLDPGGNVTISSKWLLTGGYLLQSPDNSYSRIFFIDKSNEYQTEVALNHSGLIILDTTTNNYAFMVEHAQTDCANFYLIQEYNHFRPFSIINQYRQYFGFSQGHEIELWNCQR